jgi:hypothetical protein
MNNIKKQHIIPRFIIRNWGDPSKEYHLSYYDKYNGSFSKAHPKTHGWEEEFYDPLNH